MHVILIRGLQLSGIGVVSSVGSDVSENCSREDDSRTRIKIDSKGCAIASFYRLRNQL